MCQKQETFGEWDVSKFVSGCGWRNRLSAVVTCDSRHFFYSKHAVGLRSRFCVFARIWISHCLKKKLK